MDAARVSAGHNANMPAIKTDSQALRHGSVSFIYKSHLAGNAVDVLKSQRLRPNSRPPHHNGEGSVLISAIYSSFFRRASGESGAYKGVVMARGRRYLTKVF